MTQDQQEILNEIFLGKEDPDLAFKPMTNNLKEEIPKEPTVDWLIDYLCDSSSPLARFNKERLKTLINQKEKEGVIMSKTLDTILDSYIRTDMEEKIDVDTFIEALQELVKECIPERDDPPYMTPYVSGRNQTIQEITKALRDRGLL